MIEPVTIFTLIVTVQGLAEKIHHFLKDVRNIDEHIQKTVNDFENLQDIITKVSSFLEQQQIQQCLEESSVQAILGVLNKDFRDCEGFIENFLAQTGREERSFRHRLGRFVGPGKRKDSITDVKTTLSQHIMRAHVAFHILTLHTTCRISADLKALGSEIREFQELVKKSIDTNSISDVASSRSSTMRSSQALLRHGDVESLEDAANVTLDWAVLLWQAQTDNMSSSVADGRIENTLLSLNNSQTVSRSLVSHSDSLAVRDGDRIDRGNNISEGEQELEENYSLYGGHRQGYENPTYEYSSSIYRSPTTSTQISSVKRKAVPSISSSASVAVSRASKQTVKGKIIAVCGMTGSGKSSFISQLVGKDIGIGHGLHSRTSEIHEETFQLGTETVTLVDTPGFADTEISDTYVLGEIARWMDQSYRESSLLSGIVYLHPINHNRMDGPSTQNIRMFRKLCGERSMRNIILATTMWNADELGPRLEERERELKTDFWKEMMDKGSRVFRYSDTKDSAESIVRELIGNKPEKLEIQVELVDENKHLIDTEAGACVIADLDKLQAKHEEEINTIREEMGELLSVNSEEARRELKELEKKHDRTTAKMRQAQQEREELYKQVSSLQGQLEQNNMQQANQAHTHRQELLNQRKEMEKGLDRQTKLHQKLLSEQKKDFDREAKLSQRAMDDIQKENRKKDKQLDQLQNRLRDLDMNAKREQQTALEDRTRFTSELDQIKRDNDNLSLQGQALTRDNERLTHVISNNNTNNLYGQGGGGDGSSGPRGPPPDKPSMLTVPRGTKNLQMIGQVREENKRRWKAYEKQKNAYYGVTS